MNDKLDDLKRDYQDISAPPHLASRVRASVADERVRPHSWMPAAATLTAIVAVIWMMPFAWLQQSSVTATPTKPSMAALAALKPEKPATSAPSLSQLRSVSVPRMPAKPRPGKATKPQTKYHYENRTLKEKDHAYI